VVKHIAEAGKQAPRQCKSFREILFSFGSRLRLVLHMKEDQQRFLSLLGQLPLRLTAEQAGWVLNCQPHDIPALVTSRLLKPLGNPPPNGIKYFATADLLEIAKDRSWLVKMTTAIHQHWHRQNSRKKSPSSNEVQNGHSRALDLAEVGGER
jgi:hypothetical protein